jgi:hypothetical protein
VVFDRAWPERRNIAREIERLRKELAPLHERLRRAEGDIFWGKRDAEIGTAQEWNKVFDEIDRQFGRGEGLLNLSSALGFAEGVAGVALMPKHPARWFKLLNLPTELTQRILSRRTVIDRAPWRGVAGVDRRGARRGRVGQAAIEGRLTLGSSLRVAMVSSVM